MHPSQVIIRPVVSEKSYGLLDNNKYTFLVRPDANKTEIKIAVEKVFDVKVTSVNTQNRQGKTRRTRSGVGRRANTKRAIDPGPLSDRELDVLKRLAEGKVYKQIALELELSTSTVRTHLHNTYAKLGAVDRAQAVLIATQRGWI